MPEKIYTAQKVFTGGEWLNDQVIIIEKGTIKELTGISSLQGHPHKSFHTIIPAFIDLQIYGAKGKLFSVFPETDTLHKIHEYCKRGGAYWFQPTVATNTTEVFHKCVDAVREYWKDGGEGCVGLHIEGPWISTEKKGAHIEDLIHQPTASEVRSLLEYGKGVIKTITLAPEVCGKEITDLIQRNDVIVSAGHSNASFAEATKAFDEGIRCVTHLYNAMSGLQHREPGLVGSAFLHKNVMASIIADGHHVDWSAIKIAKQIMKDRLFLITDAVTETSAGAYPHELQGDKYVASGILSGSALTMMQAVKNVIQYCGVDKTNALQMACTLPARAIGMQDQLGKIAVGLPACFISTDEEYNHFELLTG